MSKLDDKLEDWKRKLLDLTGRNPALNFRATRSSNLRILQPTAEGIIQTLLIDEAACPIFLPPEMPAIKPGGKGSLSEGVVETRGLEAGDGNWADDAPDDGSILFQASDPQKLRRRLKAVYRSMRADFEERAIRTLFVGIGMLRWSEGGTDTINSPLLLIPATLSWDPENASYELHRIDDEPVVNPSLEAKLAAAFDLSLPPLPDEWETDTLTAWLASVCDAVAAHHWTVEDTAWVSRLSFSKLSLYQDLNDHSDLINAHTIIQRMAGEYGHDSADGADGAIPLPGESDIDRDVHPSMDFAVLDADSSQRACIEAVSRGSDLVIQGPPGTGKSQTIVNLIAQLMATGRTVLFVSEKIAALEVVYERLRGAGLGRLCLELHSHKANKKDVINELYGCLRSNDQPGRPAPPDQMATLETRRHELNDYAAAINRCYGSYDVPLFELIGELATLNELPYTNPGSSSAPLDLTKERLLMAMDLSREVARIWPVLIEWNNHPWFSCKIGALTLSTRTALEQLLTESRAAVTELISEANRVAQELGLPPPESAAECLKAHSLATLVDQSPGIEPHWLDYDTRRLGTELVSWKEQYQQLESIKSEIDVSTSFELVAVKDLTRDSWARQHAALLELSGSATVATELMAVLAAALNWLDRMLVVGAELSASFQVVSEALGLEAESTITSAEAALRIIDATASGKRPKSSWFSHLVLRQLKEGIDPLATSVHACEAIRRNILERYNAAVFELPVDDLIEKCSGEYRSPLKIFNTSFRRFRAQIRTLRNDGAFPGDITSDLREIRLYHQACADTAAKHKVTIDNLGEWYAVADTDFAEIRRCLNIVDLIRALTVSPSDKLIGLVSGDLDDSSSARAVSDLRSSLFNIGAVLETPVPLCSGGVLLGMEERVANTELQALFIRIRATKAQLLHLTAFLEPFGGPHSAAALGLDEITRQVELIEKYREQRSGCAAIEVAVAERFGASTVADSLPDWLALDGILSWLQSCDADQVTVTDKIASRIRDVAAFTRINSETGNLVEASAKLCGAVAQHFTGSESANLIIARGASRTVEVLQFGSLQAIQSVLQDLFVQLDRLQEWCDFVQIETSFSRAQLGDLLRGFKEHPELKPSDLAGVARKALLQTFVDEVIQSTPTLSAFRTDLHSRKIQEFGELDRLHIRSAKQRVQTNVHARRPERHVGYAGSESAVLLTEANKKKKHLPIRKLFARMPTLLQQLKPCLLMSPLSVSQYLDPNAIKFDTVVFDEASQICSEDAISAIIRAKQLVICGDKQQLPPTDFFKQADADLGEEEDDDAEIATFESILAELEAAGLPEKSLRWHYRSATESLIAFSNRQFYKNELVTFPNANHDSERAALRFVYEPNGIYDRGGRRDNPVEADRVVQLIVEHFETTPNDSIGIVAFSQPQANAIEDRLELLRKQRPDLSPFFSEDRLTGLFIKNLERVQGDERDVIIFSIGYGRDASGRLSMNFGPVNQDGGEKRLNVAVTRARKRVIVVASITASEMDLTSSQRPGVLALHKYLEYVEQGPIVLEQSGSLGEYESPFEEDVAGAIRLMGYSVLPQVGVSSFRIDLGIVDPAQPGRFILGVECDGASYHSAHTARDRDRLRHEILTQKYSWKVHHIWSTDWLYKRRSEIQRLEEAIANARIVAPSSVPIKDDCQNDASVVLDGAEDVDKLDDDSDSMDSDGDLTGIAGVGQDRPWVKDYVVATIQARGFVGVQFHDEASSRKLQEQALEVIAIEAPVHRSIVASRVAARWSLMKVGARMLAAMNQALRRLERNGQIVIDGDFVWYAGGARCDFARRPVAGLSATFRNIDQICSNEIAFAAEQILREAVSLDAGQLAIQVARVFGFDRTGAAIRERVSGVTTALLQAGRIALVADGRYVATGGNGSTHSVL